MATQLWEIPLVEATLPTWVPLSTPPSLATSLVRASHRRTCWTRGILDFRGPGTTAAMGNTSRSRAGPPTPRLLPAFVHLDFLPVHHSPSSYAPWTIPGSTCLLGASQFALNGWDWQASVQGCVAALAGHLGYRVRFSLCFYIYVWEATLMMYPPTFSPLIAPLSIVSFLPTTYSSPLLPALLQPVQPVLPNCPDQQGSNPGIFVSSCVERPPETPRTDLSPSLVWEVGILPFQFISLLRSHFIPCMTALPTSSRSFSLS